MAVGLVLFVGGMAAAIWRATRQVLWQRLAIICGTALLIIAISSVSAVISLSLALVGILLIVVIEQRFRTLGPVEESD